MTNGVGRGRVFLGINLMMDPSVAAVRDGRVIAYSEEERHTRIKHAPGLYPLRALRYCLEEAGVTLSEIAAVGINWNLHAYTDGTMARFYEWIADRYEVDESTRAWQRRRLQLRHIDTYRRSHGGGMAASVR